MTLDLTLTGARVLMPDGLQEVSLSIADGIIQTDARPRQVDLSGYLVLPGIIDVHGDAHERHVAPRRGAMKDIAEGLRAAEAELAAQGVTTATIAQFSSWEGGVRGPEFADQIFGALRDLRGDLVTDMRGQLRFETCMTEHYADLPAKLADWGVGYVVFNDHLPHDRLAEGRKPPRLTGKALGAGRNPDDYFAYLLELHARGPEVRKMLPELCKTLRSAGIQLGSHDDATEADRQSWHALGVGVTEFPETAQAAETAKSQGSPIVLGAPNVVRGGSHKGNASALDLIAMGLCDALASDYHYPSMRRAAWFVADAGILDLAKAWGLLSSGPARVLGLEDRGALLPGLRADLIVMDPKTRRIGATLSGGQASFLHGDVAERFVRAT